MGGAAGHMLHVYEKYTTHSDAIIFYERFLNGEFKCTEKVDGFNLFVGYNQEGEFCFTRNKNQEPSTNIDSRFPQSNIARPAFESGFIAIKNALSNLPKEALDGNFLNIEILPVSMPNIIKYDEIISYIVIHSTEGNPWNNWTASDINLEQLVENLPLEIVVIPMNEYDGDIEYPFQMPVTFRSLWKISAPIIFDRNEILLSNIPTAKYNKELELKLACKDFENFILSRFKSKLAKDKTQIPAIEGIVIDDGSDLIKITGNYLDYNRAIENFDFFKNVRHFVHNTIFNTTVTTLNTLKNKNLQGVKDFLIEKRKKSFLYDWKDSIPNDSIQLLDILIDGELKCLKVFYENNQDKLRNFDKRNIFYQSFKLNRLKDVLKCVPTYEDFVRSYSLIFYDIS